MVSDWCFCWGRVGAIALLFGSSGMAMSPRPTADFCSVINAAKLPASSGRGSALCNAIIIAAGPRLVRSRARVVVRVQSHSMLIATLRTAQGRMLPEMTFVVSDKRIDRSSFERYAREIARQLSAEG